MTHGRKTGGRQKGTKNKMPGTYARMQSIRDAFKDAFHNMGGAEALQTWGAKNPTEFYRLASKLIPVEIQGGDPAKPLVIGITKFVNKDGKVERE